MKKFLSAAILVSAAITASVPAQASQLTVIVTVGQIISAVGTSSTLTSNCLSNLSNCGIYGVALVSDSRGTLNLTNSHGVTGPAAGLADAWIIHNLNSNVDPGFETSGTSTGGVAYITNDTSLKSSGSPYDSNTTATLQNGSLNNGATLSTSGIGMLSTGTTLTFLLDYGATNVVAGLDNITFELLATKFNADGSQSTTKNFLGTTTVNGLTAAPEPTSVVMFFGGFAALGLGRLRRNRKNS